MRTIFDKRKKDANNAKIAVNLGLHLKLIQIISPTGIKSEYNITLFFLVVRYNKLCKLLLAKNA